jgi:hypothetical protein
MAMFMIVPWNHDYYYVFALAPLSMLLLKGIIDRNAVLLATTTFAYLLISPPVPFSLMDRTRLFDVSFAYLINYYSLPVVGGLLLWFAATHQMFVEDVDGR